MKNQKSFALLLYALALAMYALSIIGFVTKPFEGSRITFMCMGSAFLGFGVTMMNKANNENKDAEKSEETNKDEEK